MKPPETKVAGSGAVGAVVTIVLLLNSWQHWFTPPPAGVTAALTVALSTLAGYWLPHTSRNIKTPLTLTADEMTAIKRMLASVHVLPMSASGSVPPAVQPPGTGTGSTR